MSKLRIGIIGCGGISGAHIGAYEKLDSAEIVALCDVNEAAARKRAKETGGAAFTDVEKMLTEVDLDAVSVCTPPFMHEPVVRQCAGKVKGILCEKPIARSSDEGQRMVVACAQAGTILMIAFCHRFHSPNIKIKEMIENGDLGKVLLYRNRFEGRFAGVENTWFVDREKAGGGNFLDTSVHSVDLFRFLVGEVESVSARCSTTLPIDVEDTGAMLLQAKNEVIGTLECSWVVAAGEAVVEVSGDRGAVVYDYGADKLRYFDGAAWNDVPFEPPDRFEGEVRHFVECVQKGKTPAVTGEDGVAAMKILEAAYRSIEERVWVTI